MASTKRATMPSRGLRGSLTLLLALGVLPLLPELETQVSGFALAAFSLGLVSLFSRPLASLPLWLVGLITLAGIANVLASYPSLLGQGALALLVTMAALKPLEIRADRDLRVGFLVVMILVVAVQVVDPSLATALGLGALVICALALLIEVGRGSGGEAWRPSLGLALRLVLQAAPLAALLFLLAPRLDSPLWHLPVGPRAATTGMSDWLELGSVSRLIPSQEIAFRVRFEGPAPPAKELYWRGPVLWQTDGRRWQPRAEAPGATPLPLTEAEGVVRYELTPEPSERRWLFALDLPLEVPADSVLTPDRQVLTGPLAERRRFRLASATRYRMGALPPADRRLALETPARLSPRLRQLATSFADGDADPATRVQRALGFFREQPFHYSLAPPSLGSDPLDAFLFETRRGYCEHFAASFALLMRLAGVPSRVVLGYLGGERNPLGGHVRVRQADAHAWVEVWFEGRGWTRVDPTSVIPPERIEPAPGLTWLTREAPLRLRLGDMGAAQGLLLGLGHLVDSLNAAWHAWVLGYSSERRGSLLTTLGLGVREHAGLVVGSVFAGGLGILGLGALRRWRVQRGRDPVQHLFTRCCRILARQGVPRGHGEGPLDYGRRASRLRPALAPAIEGVIRHYLPLRYGRRCDAEGLASLRSAVRELARASRGGTHGPN